MKRSYEVVIIGAGPVGMAMAALLGRFDIHVLIVDRLDAIQTDPRAIALDNEALRILKMCGLGLEDLDLVRIPAVNYLSPIFGRFGRMNTVEPIDTLPPLVTFFQPDLEASLAEKAQDAASVDVLRGVHAQVIENSESGVRVRIQNLGDGSEQDVNARFVVACDGASSATRQVLGIEFSGISYSQDWLIVDALGVPEPVEEITFYCDPARPAPHMPAPGDRQRWEFMLHPGESQEEFMQDAKIKELLKPWTKFEDIRVERKAVYRFHARLADTFQIKSVFLAGDAAHVTPPFAGQGLVSGLRDVANLGWKLKAVLRGELPVDVLASYTQERKPHAGKMIRLAQFLGELIMPSSRLKATLVHGLAKFVGLLPVVHTVFTDMKVKPQNTFDDGLFLKGRAKGVFASGSHLPQWWLQSAQGERQRSDEMFGDRFLCVGVDCNPSSLLDDDLRQQWHALGGDFVSLATPEKATKIAGYWQLDGKDLPKPQDVLILRPDRLIMGVCDASTLRPLMQKAIQLLS
jgi:3-(3-hydroxy-phenyl)propionate hydroxylase